MGTKAKLKLVVSNGPVRKMKAKTKYRKHATPRPVTVHYPWGYQGHFSSVKNALSRAHRHVMEGRIQRCNIEVDGYIVADVLMGVGRVITHWQPGWVEHDFDEE